MLGFNQDDKEFFDKAYVASLPIENWDVDDAIAFAIDATVKRRLALEDLQDRIDALEMKEIQELAQYRAERILKERDEAAKTQS